MKLMLSKKPSGKAAHEYAAFLLSEDRYEEAGVISKECLLFPDCPPAGLALKEGLPKIIAEKDKHEAEWLAIDLSFKLSDIVRKQLDEERAVTHPAFLAAYPEPARRAPFILPTVPPTDRAWLDIPSSALAERVSIARDLEREAFIPEANERFIELTAEHRESAYVRVEHIRFLTRVGRIDEANTMAKLNDPACPNLKSEYAFQLVSQGLPMGPCAIERLFVDFALASSGRWTFYYFSLPSLDVCP